MSAKVKDCYMYIKWIIGMDHGKSWRDITTEQVESEILAAKKMLLGDKNEKL